MTEETNTNVKEVFDQGLMSPALVTLVEFAARCRRSGLISGSKRVLLVARVLQPLRSASLRKALYHQS